MITVTTKDGKQMTFSPYATEIFTHLDPRRSENMELINSIREQKSKLVIPSSNIYRINTHLDPEAVSIRYSLWLRPIHQRRHFS